MSKNKRFIIVLTCMCAVLLLSNGIAGAGTCYPQSPLDKYALQYLTRTNLPYLAKPGMHVFLIGTGSPQYDALRQPQSIAIIAGGKFLVFDTGDGSTRTMDSMNLPINKINAVFLTHYHSDHVADLANLINSTWVNGRTTPINVYGPPGAVAQVDGSNKANKLDIKIRTESNEALNPTLALGTAYEFVYPQNGAPITVWSGNGVTVKAFKNDHYDVKVSCGYRIEYAGNVVVISGDTIYADSVVQNSVGADILIHEATNMAMGERIACLAETNIPAPMGSLIADHIRRAISHHSDVIDAARVAAEARVSTLVVSHIIPPIPTTLLAPDGSQVDIENLFTAGMSNIFSGSIYVAKDKMYFYLPPK